MLELLIFVSVALYFLNMARLVQGKHVAIKIPVAILYTGFCYAVYFLTTLLLAIPAASFNEEAFVIATIPASIIAFSTLIPTVLLGRKLFRKLNYEEGKIIPHTHGG